MESDLPAAGQRIVLFDFDGVLIRDDTFGMFMRERFARAWWRKALVLCASPWLLLVLPFSRRRFLRTLVHIGLLGLNEDRYQVQARAFVDALVHRPHQFHREGVLALRRHVGAGDRVVVVTGCEDALVRGVLAGLGVEQVEIVASHLKPGPLGLRTGWHNVGHHKVEALAERGVEAWRIAYSDSAQDLPMLALATEPVLVNATPKLCKRVEKALGHSVARVEWR